MKDFELISQYNPTGDQPEAIRQLTNGILNGEQAQVLLGVTGSGKTFTIANVIKNIGKPTLILSHNKTLAAQLYQEFKSFFPNNAVEYYVSYYDYYQPEAYIPSTGKYIEKELLINEEIDKKIQDHETKTYLDSSFEVIQKYFANFAGDANAKAMQKSDVVVCYLPEEYFKGPASVKKYKDFKIATIDPKKKEVLAKQRFEKWRDDGDTKLVPLIGLAYKVGYSMEVETM